MALAKSNSAEPEVTPEVEEQQAAAPEQESALDDAPETPKQTFQPPAAGPETSPPAVISAPQGAVVSQLAAEGFEGLHIDWTSFPTVVLDGNEFGTADGNSLGVKEITVRLMQTRKRFVLRTEAASEDDVELAYTYNLAELDDPGSELAQKVKKWQEEGGMSFKVKEYLEVVAMVEDSGSTLDQQMVLLQIPPTSTGRFSGYTASNLMVKKQKPGEYLTTCYVGDKITKAVKPFYPWAFKYVG